jgi:hypothetical protein
MGCNLAARTPLLQPFLCVSWNLAGVSCSRAEKNPIGLGCGLVLNVLYTDRIITD